MVRLFSCQGCHPENDTFWIFIINSWAYQWIILKFDFYEEKIIKFLLSIVNFNEIRKVSYLIRFNL